MSENFLNILDFFVLGLSKCQKNAQVPKCQNFRIFLIRKKKNSEKNSENLEIHPAYKFHDFAGISAENFHIFHFWSK